MKTNLLVTIAVLLLPILGWSADETMESRLQKGLFEEEANHNLDAAKSEYLRVITDFEKEQKIAGTAVLHMAQALRKEGKTNEAQVYFERILRDFSSNVELVASAREAMGIHVGSTNVVEAESSEVAEAKEIQRLSKVYDESPDLIRKSSIGTAVKNDQIRLARFLLEKGVSPNTGMGRGIEMALPTAINHGNRAMVDLLLQYHAEVRPDDLRTIVLKQNGEMLEFLLDHKVYQELLVRDSSPLGWAADSGSKAIVEILVRAGADVRSKFGKLAMGTAATFGHLAVLDFLLDQGADIEATIHPGITPLYMAVQMHNQAVVEELLRRGANPNNRLPLGAAAAVGDLSMAERLLKLGANVRATNASGSTALHFAVAAKSNDVLRLLLKLSPDVNARTVEGISPLWAAMRATNAPYMENLQLLIDAGANINDVLHLPGQTNGPFVTRGTYTFNGRTPLFDSIYNIGNNLLFYPRMGTPLGFPPMDFVSIAKLLIEKGANPNIKTDTGELILDHLFSLRDHRIETIPPKTRDELIALLKAHGAVSSTP